MICSQAFSPSSIFVNSLSIAPSGTVVEPGGSAFISRFAPWIIKAATSAILTVQYWFLHASFQVLSYTSHFTNAINAIYIYARLRELFHTYHNI